MLRRGDARPKPAPWPDAGHVLALREPARPRSRAGSCSLSPSSRCRSRSPPVRSGRARPTACTTGSSPRSASRPWPRAASSSSTPASTATPTALPRPLSRRRWRPGPRRPVRHRLAGRATAPGRRPRGHGRRVHPAPRSAGTRAPPARPRPGPEDIVRYRLTQVASDVTHWPEYDYVLVNKDFEASIAARPRDPRRRAAAPEAPAGTWRLRPAVPGGREAVGLPSLRSGPQPGAPNELAAKRP